MLGHRLRRWPNNKPSLDSCLVLAAILFYCIQLSLCCIFSDPPGQPQNLHIENLKKTGCTLVWEPPTSDGGSPITGYYVEKSAGFSSRWIKVNRDPLSTTSVTYKDLVEGSEYEYRVFAENEAGAGKPSDTTGMFVAKDPYGKPGKPSQPCVDEITAESAVLSWSPPTTDGASGITNYKLEMKQAGDLRWKELNRGTAITATTYTVTGLKPQTGFEFRVSAENKAGCGPTSATSEQAKYGK